VRGTGFRVGAIHIEGSGESRRTLRLITPVSPPRNANLDSGLAVWQTPGVFTTRFRSRTYDADA